LTAGRIRVGGAPDNDLQIAADGVSRHHAVLERVADGYRLTDQNSTNGTFVNGQRIGVGAAVAIHEGDEIRFGAQRYQLRRDSRPAASPGLGRIRTGVVIAAFVAIATTAFVAIRRLIPRMAETDRVKVASNGISGAATDGGVMAPSVSASSTSVNAATGTASGRPNGFAAAPIAGTSRPDEDSASAPDWLKEIDHYRNLAGLPPVTADMNLAAGEIAHARYLVKTDGGNIKTGFIGAEAHTEDPSSPWFSHAGLIAAEGSDVEAGANPAGTPWLNADAAINGWMSAPFHRLAILNPLLHGVGYGQFCDAGSCAAGVNLLTDMEPPPPEPKILPRPIMFPPDGSALPLKSFEGEWPDPLTSCPGYTAPSGLGITLQLGMTLAARMTDFQVTRADIDSAASMPIEVCGFDSGNYVNPDASAQERGRHILVNLGAVVIIPRVPLEPGQYHVTLAADGRRYAWSFEIVQ
jgi:uncharacterized protein YkwD